MQKLGYLLIAISFLTGAYLSVRHEEVVSALPFLGSLAVGALGVCMARFAGRKQSHHQEVLTSNMRTLEENLARLVADSAEFDQNKGAIDVYELRHHIERTFTGPLGDFVEARESLAHRYGLQAYAEVMSQFAAGERYINRVWSASTDGYIDEAHTYITKAAGQFRETQETLGRLTVAG